MLSVDKIEAIELLHHRLVVFLYDGAADKIFFKNFVKFFTKNDAIISFLVPHFPDFFYFQVVFLCIHFAHSYKIKFRLKFREPPSHIVVRCLCLAIKVQVLLFIKDGLLAFERFFDWKLRHQLIIKRKTKKSTLVKNTSDSILHFCCMNTLETVSLQHIRKLAKPEMRHIQQIAVVKCVFIHIVTEFFTNSFYR